MRGEMAQVKAKIEIHVKIDTDEYAIPADGNLSLQIKDDMREAIETSLPFEINVINVIKVTRTGIKNDAENSENFD